MRLLITSFFVFLISNFCYAGIEHELLLEQYNECMVRVTHDATPDSKTGAIIFRAYKIENGIHYPCEINENITSTSLNNAFQNYISLSDLKPVTSVMIGRLIRYLWARSFLEKNSISKVTHAEFNKVIFNSPIIEPFKNAVNNFNYSITNVSCEKILYDENNFAIDALCWLIIEEL
jgi:hypothetical protein